MTARAVPRIAIVRAFDADGLTPGRMVLAGRTLIDRALDRLAAAGVARVFVEQQAGTDGLEQHLARRPPGPEIVLLSTAGAGQPLAETVAALLDDGRLVPDDRFFVIDGDVAWFDGPAPALLRLAHGFDENELDAVLLLARAVSITAGSERDGLALDPMGFVRRPKGRELTPFVPAGVQLLTARLFAPPADDLPIVPPGDPSSIVVHDDPLPSIDRIWDDAIARHRLGGQVHDSDWFHVNSPSDLALAEAGFEDRLSGVRP